jgi:hypothetical protein
MAPTLACFAPLTIEISRVGSYFAPVVFFGEVGNDYSRIDVT